MALDDVNAAVEAGTLLAVVGHNGAGKSTLLNIVSGLIRASSGRVDIGPGARLMWSPQRTMIDWSLTIKQNIDLVARLSGAPKSRVDEMLALLDLEQVASQQAEYVSGGQLQRAQIGRALVCEADVYVLDEPASGLDPAAADLVMGYLRQRAAEGRVVIVSSHDLDAVERMASDLLLLDGGRVQAHMPVPDFIAKAGATLTVNVQLSTPLDKPVTYAEGLPVGWSLDLNDAGDQRAVSVPMTTGLPEVLAWLPAELPIKNLSTQKESLRDIYLKRHAAPARTPAEPGVRQ
jgi:ABC-type multidrug transport system ATPase subunit